MVVDIRFISGGKFSLTLGKLIYKFNNFRFSFQIRIESQRFSLFLDDTAVCSTAERFLLLWQTMKRNIYVKSWK